MSNKSIRGEGDRLKGEFVRFVVVGVAATAVHLLIYWTINAAFSLTENDRIGLNVSYSIGYLASFVGNYALSLKWTFKTKGSIGKGIGFAFSHAVNYGLHMGLLNLFLLLGMGAALSRFLVAAVPQLIEMMPALARPDTLLPLPVYLIAIPVNFLLVRFFLRRGDASVNRKG